jgi:hypothetical protein
MRLLGGAMSAARQSAKHFPPDGEFASGLIERAMALVGVNDGGTYDPSKKSN